MKTILKIILAFDIFIVLYCGLIWYLFTEGESVTTNSFFFMILCLAVRILGTTITELMKQAK